MTNFKTLVTPVIIDRSTDKAVLAKMRRQNAWQVEDYCDSYISVWFPKSQIEINDGRIVAASDWIIREKIKANACYYGNQSYKGFEESALDTVEKAERREVALNAGIARYEELVRRAKEAGLPVRNRMKTETIMDIAQKHGVAL
jgi:hypothetical protein